MSGSYDEEPRKNVSPTLSLLLAAVPVVRMA